MNAAPKVSDTVIHAILAQYGLDAATGSTRSIFNEKYSFTHPQKIY